MAAKKPAMYGSIAGEMAELVTDMVSRARARYTREAAEDYTNENPPVTGEEGSEES